jgi:hypothetical protein
VLAHLLPAPRANGAERGQENGSVIGRGRHGRAGALGGGKSHLEKKKTSRTSAKLLSSPNLLEEKFSDFIARGCFGGKRTWPPSSTGAALERRPLGAWFLFP